MKRGITTTNLLETRQTDYVPEAVDTTIDPLHQLLAESRRWPLLAPAEEIELAQRIERELALKLGHEPSNEEIANAAELTVEEVEEIRAADQAPASLDKTVGDDGDTAFGDLLAADQLSPEEEVAEAWQSDVLQTAVADLPEQERRVIELRFGAGPEGKMHTLGGDAERTRQIEERALRRLSQNTDLSVLRDAA